jgi:type I restriction enzyme S subunit
MSTKQKQSRTPALRFSEFSGEWEEQKFGDIAERYNGLKSKTKKDFGSGFAYITYTQIFENSKINVDKFEKVQVGEDENQNKAKYGDIFFTTSSETPLEVGFSSVLLDKNIEPYLNSFAFGVRPNSLDILKPEFAQYYFRTETFRRKMYRLAQGSTRFNISRVEFMTTNVLLPDSEEQKKIAEFLSAADEWIDNLKKRKEKLEKYKHGLMQKLFPKKGETVPQFRFPEFPGEWEEEKLGDVSDFSKGKGIRKKDIVEDGKNVCIHYGDLYTKYSELVNNVESRTNKSLENSILSEKNDVLIPSSGETALDIATASCVNKEGVILGSDINILKLDDDLNGGFLARYITGSLQKYVASFAQGNSVVHIYSRHLSKVKINVPSIEEQKKIADFLTSADKLIDKNQEDIDAAQKWKRGLMQQMFV